MTTTKSAQFDREAATSPPKHKEAQPSGNIVANEVSQCIGRYPNLLRPAIFNEKILQRSLGPNQIPADYRLHCFGGRPGRPIINNQGRVVADDALKRTVGRVADSKAVRLV